VPFNNQQGGYYAMQWNSTAIRVWMWPYSNAPRDLPSNPNPDPDSWGEPFANFILDAKNCDPKHFQSLQMIINLTFCGDWAGSVFASTCQGVANGQSCNDFVQNNPTYFQDAYWKIQFISVFQQS
jgi:hypothetical protein